MISLALPRKETLGDLKIGLFDKLVLRLTWDSFLFEISEFFTFRQNNFSKGKYSNQ